MIKNSLLIILSELDPEFFETRVGATREEVKNVYKKNELTHFSEDEKVIIHNTFNEVLNGLDIKPFNTLVGAKRNEVEALFKKINQLFN